MEDGVTIVGNNPFSNLTTVQPLGIIVVLILGLYLIHCRRKLAVLPFLLMACSVSSAQRIVVFGLDFDFLRIMVVFGVCRLFLKKEYAYFKLNSLDKVMILWTSSSIVLYTLQYGTMSAFINRLGFGFDAFGMYFLFRCLIRDWSDIDSIVKGAIWISVPIAFFFTAEQLTGRNVFSTFGGVPQITVIREGRLRCQGAFSHAILAGCFWVSLMPLLVAMWWKPKQSKVRPLIGFVCSSIIVYCCASSTPVMAMALACFGGFMFYFRNSMKRIRLSIIMMIIFLHLVMFTPVWHLISRMDVIAGSTGWHRYNLINQTIIHISEWWFYGCSGQRVLEWGVWAADVTNQYILEGVQGGILTMGLFIATIAVAYQKVGVLWRSELHNPYYLALSWALGVSLFVHTVNFFAVSYFGQITMIWYLLLAMIGSLSMNIKSEKKYIAIHKCKKAQVV